MNEKGKFLLLATALDRKVISEKEKEKALGTISIETLIAVITRGPMQSYIQDLAKRSLPIKMKELDKEDLAKYLGNRDHDVRSIAVAVLIEKEGDNFIKQQLGL